MILEEELSRKQIFKLAAERGVLHDIKAIYAKYDALISRLPSHRADELKAIAAQAIIEIHNIISPSDGTLTINGTRIK